MLLVFNRSPADRNLLRVFNKSANNLLKYIFQSYSIKAFDDTAVGYDLN